MVLLDEMYPQLRENVIIVLEVAIIRGRLMGQTYALLDSRYKSCRYRRSKNAHGMGVIEDCDDRKLNEQHRLWISGILNVMQLWKKILKRYD